MKLLIKNKRLKEEIPYELFALFINTVMIIDLLRIIVGNVNALEIVRNGIYVFTAMYVIYHAIGHKHLSVLMAFGMGYAFLAAFSLLRNDGITEVVLSGSMIFLTRCLAAFYLAYYLPINECFFKKMKKYYVILFLYCFVYITTHTSGIYATDGSYMTFSYNILIMTLVCLLNCVEKPTPLRTLGVVVLLGIIVAYGARGPLICIVISLLLFLWYKFASFSVWKKIILFCFCIGGGSGLFMVRNTIIDILLRFNPPSRTLYLLKNFKIDNLSGRNTYYDLLRTEINKNWFLPHGIYSDRLILSGGGMSSNVDLSQYYAHNLPIEVMYQFGGFIGVLVLIFLIVKIIKSYIIVIKQNNHKLAIVYCAFFSGITTLFFSSSYLINERAWLVFGIVFSAGKFVNQKSIVQKCRLRQ